MLASGGYINGAYFNLLDEPVSEVLYHLEVFNHAKTIEKQAYEEHKKQNAVNSMLGMAQGMEWEQAE